VVSKFELGSIEYGAEHCGAKVVVCMGHSGCGAVAATISGGAEGNIKSIVDEIKSAIGNEKDATRAEDLNIAWCKRKVSESAVIEELVNGGKLIVVGAKYNLVTGAVLFST
jgi:carbonic anhydrase